MRLGMPKYEIQMDKFLDPVTFVVDLEKFIISGFYSHP